MLKTLTPAQRLIVAADFKLPADQGRFWVEAQVIELAKKLAGTGVVLKVNSALRACGYGLIDAIHDQGLGVFADLKLYDIPNTLEADGDLLNRSKPEILTTVCSAGVAAMSALKAKLPDTEVLGVTVLTSLNNDDSQAMFACSTVEAVLKLSQFAADAKIDGLISSPKEAEALRAKFGILLSLNTPAIRPLWYKDSKDDQNPARIMTPAKAIKAGADRIVVGRPVTGAENPYDAVMWTIDEIASALA